LAAPEPPKPPRQSGQSLEILGGHLAAFAVGDELEGNLLTFMQLAKTGALHRAYMNEGVATAIIGCDEPKTFLAIEPLYGSLCHGNPFIYGAVLAGEAPAVEIAFSGKTIVSFREKFSARIQVIRLFIDTLNMMRKRRKNKSFLRYPPRREKSIPGNLPA
jgi:hypothetical protein